MVESFISWGEFEIEDDPLAEVAFEVGCLWTEMRYEPYPITRIMRSPSVVLVARAAMATNRELDWTPLADGWAEVRVGPAP